MPASEIDDIFAKKTDSSSNKKRKAQDETVASSSKSTSDASKKKKRKKKQRDDVVPSSAASGSALASADSKIPSPMQNVETVVDTSLNPSEKSSKTNGSAENTTKIKRPKQKTTEGDDLKKFKDSRGSGLRRRTDEGYAIFKEDELGISSGGGDTPLCPFDCDCCF